MTAALRAGG